MPIELEQYTEWLDEISNQPPWRSQADKESDYYDCNQLDSDLLHRMRMLGIPPAIEPIIASTIDGVVGIEAKGRLDWQVVAERGGEADEVAAAIGRELHVAERKTRADAACAAAFAEQIKVGLGWVEVGRESNPYQFPFRVRPVHRNEIWFDWSSAFDDLSDARYLLRRKWVDRDMIKLMFPKHQALIDNAGNGWTSIGQLMSEDGGSTDLSMSWDIERGWSREEMEWRDAGRRRLCLAELWYRSWERAKVIHLPDGRVVEVEAGNPVHVLAGEYYGVKDAVVQRMHLSWWLGPHRLHDGPSPHAHNNFPYVPFWGKREDRTGVPYGIIRGIMYLQDEINARVSKMQWGLSSVWTERTEGIVKMTDSEFRAMSARPDADFVLDENRVRNGGIFKRHLDFDLNAQQFSRLQDCRESVQRASGITPALLGNETGATSGVAISSLIDQATNTLALYMDRFKTGRTQVGELLMNGIIEDMEDGREVTIPATLTKPERVVVLNGQGDDGLRANDVSKTRLKVELSDAPSTPTYKAQSLQTLSNVTSNMPPNLQAVVIPHLLNLMDIPDRQEMIESVKAETAVPDEKSVQQMIDQAVRQALTEKLVAQKDRELDIKERLAETDVLKKGVDASLAAMQAGAVIAQNPGIAPVGDALLQAASPRRNGAAAGMNGIEEVGGAGLGAEPQASDTATVPGNSSEMVVDEPLYAARREGQEAIQ
jgi:hypothetical protein